MGVRAYPSVLEIPTPWTWRLSSCPAPGWPRCLGSTPDKRGHCHYRGLQRAWGGGDRQRRGGPGHGPAERHPPVGAQLPGDYQYRPAGLLERQFLPVDAPPGKHHAHLQSGAVGVAALEYAQAERIGLSKFVSVGNKADLNENDFLAYLQEDPQTDVILLYLEDLADPRRFFQLAQESGSRKPILAIKSGRTAAGAKAASSHTGALAGSTRPMTPSSPNAASLGWSPWKNYSITPWPSPPNPSPGATGPRSSPMPGAWGLWPGRGGALRPDHGRFPGSHRATAPGGLAPCGQHP